MSKSFILKIMIIVVICIILIIGASLYMFGQKQEQNENLKNVEESQEEEDTLIRKQEQLTKIEGESQFYNGLHYIDLYLNYIEEENEKAVVETTYSEGTEKNSTSEINKLKESKFYAQSGYYKYYDENHSIYVYQGKLEKNNKYIVCVFGVIFDYQNSTYAIIRKDSVEDIDKMSLNFNIENKNNNCYEYYNAEENEIIEKTYNNFKTKVDQNLIEEGYNTLDSEYKSAKFTDINSYKYYINKRKDKIITSNIKNYKLAIIENKSKYTIVDQYNNYYIFYITGPMEYTMMLDNYTIVDEETMNNYNNSDKYSKAHTCVDIFINMINNEDYEKAYLKTNFNSLSEFEKYIKNNFYEENTLEIENVEEEDNMYIVKAKVYSDSNKDTDPIFKNFKVQLKEENGIEFKIEV